MPSGVYQHKPNQGWQKGYIPSKEQRKKQRLAKLGRKQSLQTRRKRSIAMTDNPKNAWYKHGNSRKEKGDYYKTLEYRL